MKKSRFSEQQIAFILKQADDGFSVEEVCRKAGVSQQTYYRWRKKYGRLMPSEVKRLKQLEEENGAGSNGWWRTCPWTRRCCRMFWQKSCSACGVPTPG